MKSNVEVLPQRDTPINLPWHEIRRACGPQISQIESKLLKKLDEMEICRVSNGEQINDIHFPTSILVY